MNGDYDQMKYRLLEDQFRSMKTRNEELETRILDIIEKSETDKLALCRELDKMAQELELLKGTKIPGSADLLKSTEAPVPVEPAAPEDPLIDRSRPLVLPKTPKGKTTTFEFHDIPLLSKREGMIYGFSWTRENVVKAV